MRRSKTFVSRIETHGSPLQAGQRVWKGPKAMMQAVVQMNVCQLGARLQDGEALCRIDAGLLAIAEVDVLQLREARDGCRELFKSTHVKVQEGQLRQACHRLGKGTQPVQAEVDKRRHAVKADRYVSHKLLDSSDIIEFRPNGQALEFLRMHAHV